MLMNINVETTIAIYITISIFVLIGLIIFPFLFAEFYYNEKNKIILYMLMILFNSWLIYKNYLPENSKRPQILFELILLITIPYFYILKSFLKNYHIKKRKIIYYVYFIFVHFMIWIYLF